MREDVGIVEGWRAIPANHQRNPLQGGSGCDSGKEDGDSSEHVREVDVEHEMFELSKCFKSDVRFVPEGFRLWTFHYQEDLEKHET